VDNRYDLHGTIRHVHPDVTLAKLKKKLSQFGITRVADVTGLDHVKIPVMVAIRPNAKHLATSQGKGLTRDLASISAIMESIELFHAELTLPSYIRGSYNELKSKNYNVLNPSK